MPSKRKGYHPLSIRLPAGAHKMLRALCEAEGARTGRDPHRCSTAVIVQALTLSYQSTSGG